MGKWSDLGRESRLSGSFTGSPSTSNKLSHISWLNADGLAQKRWAGSMQMGWLKRDGLALKRWAGSKEMGWLNE